MDASRASTTTVVFLTEVPTPYREPLLDRLAERVDLPVLYCSEGDPWRGGGSPVGAGEVLAGFSIGGRRGGTNWKINPSVRRRLWQLRPGVVVVGGYAQPTMLLAILWCRAHKVPYLLHFESHGLAPRSRLRKMLREPLLRWAISGASAFLPASTLAKDHLVRHGAPSDRMYVLPNSPDVEAIRRAAVEARAQLVDDPAGPLFLYIGRLIGAKDLGTLILAYSEVCKRHQTARLLICGEGPEEASLKMLVDSLRLDRVEFRGHVPNHEIPQLLAAADCFVLASTFEPFGVVVVEALAAGVPVVVSDQVGSASDFVQNGENGFIFRAGDSLDLADRMVQVLDLDGERAEAAAVRAAQRFDHEACLEILTDALSAATSR